jgi:hypothetical protein
MAKNKKVSRETCPHCGANMVKFRHSLSGMYVGIIMQIYANMNSERTVDIGTLDMTYNQKNNLQKLQYWGIIRSTKKHSGRWRLTDAGLRFVEGELKLRKYVWTYRGKVMEYDGPEILFSQMQDKKYRRRDDYTSDAQDVVITSDSNGQSAFC